MSFSWTYLTRRVVFMNYRDYIAVGLIGSWAVGSIIEKSCKDKDNSWVMQHIYTDDESDVSFREVTNKTDGAIRRKHAIAYRAKIEKMRADKERAA